MEESDISGSRVAGLVIGERNASPAHAEVKRSRFNHNSIGIGVLAGSSADVEDSECSENNERIIVFEQGSHLNLKKTAIVSNRDHGLQVYANAEATVTDSAFRNNARGALSGVPRKAAQRGSLTLEDCRVGGNQVFGVGACAQSAATHQVTSALPRRSRNFIDNAARDREAHAASGIVDAAARELRLFA